MARFLNGELRIGESSVLSYFIWRSTTLKRWELEDRVYLGGEQGKFMKCEERQVVVIVFEEIYESCLCDIPEYFTGTLCPLLLQNAPRMMF